MAGEKVLYPGPGCMVEFMQGNSPTLALVLEEQGGRLRLYAQNRRELALSASRLLPWSGPSLGSGLSRQAMDEALERHRKARAELTDTLNILELWEMSQGEMEKASADWFAELVWEKPGVDQIAAVGHSLLQGKTHFRFNPPDFEIFPEHTVATRLAEAEAQSEREAVLGAGSDLLKKLWDIYCRRRGPLTPEEAPGEELARKLSGLLLARLAGEEGGETETLWRQLVKGLPENPHMALFLAEAWGLVPEHYNFLLDRAGYHRNDSWADDFADACVELRARTLAAVSELPDESGSAGFVTVDPAHTRDRDDALCVLADEDGGYRVRVALACPSLHWPFGSAFDRAVLRRASSLYLPEGTLHMLPPDAGWPTFGLDANQKRLALVLDIRVRVDGECVSCEPRLASVRVAANLSLAECESVLATAPGPVADEDPLCVFSPEPPSAEPMLPPRNNPATPHADMLKRAYALGLILQSRRLASGAVITERPDPEVTIEKGEGGARVRIENAPQPHRSHLLVGEIMILANSALATHAHKRGIPLLYRAQDVALPREFAGVWTAPHDISRVVRALPPAGLELQPKRHAGLGLSIYATASSPMRRYSDLLNQGQITAALTRGEPVFSEAELAAMLPLLSARQDEVGQVQRFRPRYWKLLFFRQHGDKKWWPAEVTEENEYFVTVALPWAQLMVRARRALFDERMHPGQRVEVRLGKVNPLLNEIQILESREA